MPKTPFELFGIECGHGWRGLYGPLIKKAEAEGVEILQIKEKFGGLRFYVSDASDELYAAIDDAENKSFTICERCGNPGKRMSVHGWIRTRCDEHRPPE